MIKNYIKIAWRNIIRRKGYSIINIAGLSVGIAACLLIFVVIKYELSFDTYQPNYKNIYHVVTRVKQDDGVNYNPGVANPTSRAMRLEFPLAKVAALESSYGSQITVQGNNGSAAGDKKFTENLGVAFVEPQFFDVFKWNWLSGQAAVLNNPDMVVLSKSSAIKYFGDWKAAVGKVIKMDNLLTLKVAGIVDDAPENSDFPLKVIVSYPSWKEYPKNYNYTDNWDGVGSSHEVYISLPANTSIAKTNVQLAAFSKKYFTDRNGLIRTLFLQPLAELHFDNRFTNTFGDHLTSMATIHTLSFIGLLIIIMAAINFVNLSTAQSVGRSKEVGIRKVLGSSRPQLIIQVIFETGMIVFGAVVLAVIIAKFALPYLTHVASVPQDLSLLNAGCLVFLVCTTIVVVILSGLYPALVVSGFKPVLALKNKITAASVGGVSLRRVLVVAQFGISQLLIIGTIVAVNQMDFVNKADLGFNKEAILIIPGYTDSISLQKMAAFKQTLLQNPSIRSVSFTSDPPSSGNDWSTNFAFDHAGKDENFQVDLKQGDADYFKTFGLRFAAGKGYEPSDTIRQVVVNETLMHKLNIQKPDEIIGKTIRIGGGSWATITGVVKDFKPKSLKEGITPIAIFPRKSVESEAAIKLQTKNLKSTVASIQKLWENTYPEYAYNGYFLDDNIAQFYMQENQLALVYKIFAGIAIFISCLGLYGLVSFMAMQRTKEVGIRKVLGASVSSIVYLFSKEFLVLIIMSSILAVPVAWFLMSGWLQNFVYRISLNAWIFVLAIAVSLIIAWLTVGYKAIKAALVNPVRSLRSE